MGAPAYAPVPEGPGFAAQPFGAKMNPASEMTPSAPNQPTPPLPPEPNLVTLAVALGKQPEAAISTPPDESGPSIKPQPVSKKLEDYRTRTTAAVDDEVQLLSQCHASKGQTSASSRTSLLKLASATFKVASTDVAWVHRIARSQGSPPAAGRPAFPFR
jgi:hypothetical protein